MASDRVPTAAIERTVAAIVGLDRAAARSPVRAGWLQRSRIDAALRATEADGIPVDRGAFLAVLLGLPQRRADEGTHRALRWLKILLTLAPGGARPGTGGATGELGQPLDAMAIAAVGADPIGVRTAKAAYERARRAAGVGVVAALGEGLRQALDNDGSAGAAVTAIPFHLARTGLISEPWPGLVPASTRAAGAIAGAGRLGLAVLDGLADQATHELAALDRLDAAWRRWHAKVAALGARSNSRLPALLHLVAALPAVSPAYVAQAWKKTMPCTAAGASHLLRQLVALDIVAEATGRQTWRLYVPVDLAYLRQFGRPLVAGKGKVDALDLLADDRAPMTLDGMTTTPLEPMVMPGPVEADWAAMMAAIDGVNERAQKFWTDRTKRALEDRSV